MSKRPDPEILRDDRNVLPLSVSSPLKKGVQVIRCDSCMKLWTEFEAVSFRGCPTCHGSRFRGGYPGTLDWIRLWFLWLTGSWRVRRVNPKAYLSQKARKSGA